MADTTETRDAINAAVASTAKPFDATGELVVLPAEYHITDLEQYRDKPRRIRRAVTLATLDSFVAYLDRHKNDETSVFGSIGDNGGIFKAVIDDHGKGAPAHGDHRATFQPAFSLEWRRWSGINGKQTTQSAFARFLEDYHTDVVAPDGATLLEIAHTLEAKKGVEFKSGVKLHDGTNQIAFIETQEAKAGIKGNLEVPPLIVLHIPVFEGEVPRDIDAFLRYRINEGHLTFIVEIKDAERVVREQLDAMFDQIGGHVNHAYFGTL